MPALKARPLAILLTQSQKSLRKSQAELGDVLGVTRTTINRWCNGHAGRALRLSEQQAKKLVMALFPTDRLLAAEVAVAHGETLDGLGLESSGIDPAHLVDSVVCAAADAAALAPARLRLALRAAFLRAKAVGLSIDDVLAALKTAPASASGPRPDNASVAGR